MGRQRKLSRRNSPASPILDAGQLNEIVQSLRLSRQQAKIVELILQGRKDKQIAVDLGLSVHTVRTYLKRTFERLGVDDRFDLLLQILANCQIACEHQECPRKQ